MGCTSSSKKQHDSLSSVSQTPIDGTNSIVVPELTNNIVDNLIAKTKFTREDIHDWWHGFLSDCPSGVLDKRKFIEVYKYRYPNGKAQKFCDHVFRTFNPDKHSHVIDFERFMCAIDITLHGSPTEKLDWAFSMYDIDGDHRISKSEMTNVIDSMFDLLGKDKKGKNSPRKHVEHIFQRIDTNHDNYLSKEEFMIGCQSHEHIRTILAPHY